MFELFRFYKHMYVLLFDNNTCTQVVICLKKNDKKNVRKNGAICLC